MAWLESWRLSVLCTLLSISFCPAGIAGTRLASTPTTESFQKHQHQAEHNLRSIPAAPPPVLSPSRLPSSLDRKIAPASSFNSKQLDKQLQRYLRLVAESGRPDILIVGSSRALQGVDPAVLQQTLASRGYAKLSIFNFGVNGATAQLVDLILRKLLTPDQMPRLILWADGARAFNSGRIDVTYNRAIASPDYKLLASGIRPALRPIESTRTEQRCAEIDSKLFSHELIDQPKYFDFLPYRSSSSSPRRLCRTGLKLLTPTPVTPVGSYDRTLQETTGFQPLSDRFNPIAYFQRYPNVRGEYDADYRNFTLEGKQTEALNNIVTFAKARKIPVVFVNLPLTQIYLDETRTVYEQQFRAYLQRRTRSQPLIVYDLSQRWLNQNSYFTDPSHLNRYGAAAIATQVGRLLRLP